MMMMMWEEQTDSSLFGNELKSYKQIKIFIIKKHKLITFQVEIMFFK